MPLWARCGAGSLQATDNEDGKTDDEKEEELLDERHGATDGGIFEGIVRNVASFLTGSLWGYFRSTQKTTECHSADLFHSPEFRLPVDIPTTSCDQSAADSPNFAKEDGPSSSSVNFTDLQSPVPLTESQTRLLRDPRSQTPDRHINEARSQECSDAMDDIHEVLSSTLGALYGRATPAAVKQAWEVLTDSYAGDCSRFKSEFLNPVLELLHRVQEIQDTGDVPNSTWPLSVGSSVVVHLGRRNCRYLQDIGDFCISAVLGSSSRRPGIVVSCLTFDGIAERAVDDQEFGSLLTMDWARKIREATDQDLVFILRQCMVASEYTVRHLRWDEIPHLDPRNLSSGAFQVKNWSIEKENGYVSSESLLCNDNTRVVQSTQCVHANRHVQYAAKRDSRADGYSTLHSSKPTRKDFKQDHVVLTRSLDDTVINSCCSLHEPVRCHSPSQSSDQRSPSSGEDTFIPVSVCHRTDAKLADEVTNVRPVSTAEEDRLSLIHQPHSPPSPSDIGLPHSPPSFSTSSQSSLPGTNYYGTWHGSRKASGHKKTGPTSRSKTDGAHSDRSGGCQHRHINSGSQTCLGGFIDGKDVTENLLADCVPVELNRSSCSIQEHRKLEIPELITHVDNELLNSGVAILPGCRDEDGRNLVYIFTCSSLWHERRVSSTELARLMMYYYTVPRKKYSQEGIAVVADIRGAAPYTVNILLEALNLFQENIPGSLGIVHLFADKSSQNYIIKSPVYDTKAHVNLKIMLTLDCLQQYVNSSQVPTVLDGDYPYNHESWVRFRKKLEMFMTSCRAVACHLVDTMQEISASERMPQSVAESAEMIRAHEQIVKLAFEDERLLTLQNDGPAIFSSLMRERESFAHSEDYSFAMEQATELHQNLQETISRLARLADDHMTKLHNCLQLREYEDECHKVIDWLSQDGETILQKHALAADNLRMVRHQQKDFEKFYYSAVSYIEKGNDLLEEASMLSQCGSFPEATGYKDLAKTLRRQLQNFTGQLEETRERIEGTAKCYNLLDKSYEWALEAMKYVSSMKMEHSTTVEGLDKLLKSLSIYLSEHPPIAEDSFAAMLDAAQKLNNDKLLEQCRMAKVRCQETQQLLQLRQATLKRARNQIELEQARKEDRGDRNRNVHSVGSNSQTMGGPFDGFSQTIRNDSRDLAQSSVDSQSVSSNLFLTPSVKGNNLKTERTEVVCLKSTWRPQDSSTPVFTNWQGADDGSLVAVGSETFSKKGPSRSLSVGSDVCDASPLFLSPGATSDFHDKANSNTSPSHISLSSSFSSPLPTSCQYVPSSVSVPISPVLSASETPLRGRLYRPSSSISGVYNSSNAARSSIRRPISHPGKPAECSLPAGSIPISRPHKKILKRASTAPIPMLTSPILEEGQFGHSSVDLDKSSDVENERNEAREQQNTKSLSVITSSTESLPSMPEEDEADLDMSPKHEHQDPNSNSSVKSWTPLPVNTHLHKSARGTPTGHLADLHLSEAEAKSRRTVSLIMSEMIQTERDYVRALQFITDHYVPELLRDDVPQMLRGKRTVIFGNLEKILQFHSQYFLKQLETCQQQPFLVGQFFLQHETMFYLYALYNKNKPKSDCLMTEYGKEFFRRKQLQLGDKMDLSSYLLKPVQRMGKYALLLKQLLKECSETEMEYPELKAAEEMVKFQLRHGNDLLAMDSLRDCDVNLQEQGRLLRQEEFLVFQGRKKSMRRIFLFEDLILFSKTRRGRQGQHDIYIYKTSFKTADIGLTENYGDSGYKFEIWFRRRSVGENYVFQAPSSEVKKSWVKDISRLLWRQAIRNRESQINELATMGIGNKPCLDIKPSEDNIQDRSINVPLCNRGARTRNSIAVSSFDYLRNGNKRPHSIISVSSTSSSGSSQSSFGLLGSLNLAFDPLDSPRVNRRSVLSNESGIVMDSDTSGGDVGLENRGPVPSHPSQASAGPVSSVKSYFDVMKSRVLKQKYSDQLYTDISGNFVRPSNQKPTYH